MTRLRCALLASLVVSIPAAGLVVSGCSSSSNSAGPGAGAEGGAEASVEAGPAEGGEAGKKGFKLQWLVQPIGSKIGLVEAGAPTEAGAEAGGAEAGGTEGGTDEGGVYGGGSDAGDAGQGDGSVPGLEGVKVCVYQNTDIPCTTTAADGTFTLTGFSALTNAAITLDKAGYQPQLLSIQTASTDMDERQYPVYMPDTDGGAPPIGTAIDPTKGRLTTFILGSSPTANGDFRGEPGASMTLMPMSGLGPFYLGQGGIVEGATAYTDTGLQALYFNLTPGMYTLTYNDPDPMKDCEPVLFPFDSRGIAGPMGSHQVSFPVVAGYTTGNIGEICTTGAPIVAVDGGHD